ncbi:neuromedin-U receptor 2-like protein [Leptotrombidium deliense]|uniref:Neuromedin-U receptor 2-like protein n=1 Tax=Leptotrombidium deliense TaxID=299467 RepID=A0A443SCK2_9ACAR|nr:neuromedin-U receptor 2-like protein [Leptotrombidium deliense]
MITNLSQTSDQHSDAVIHIFNILTYISGVTYYLTATINPILYQLMSLKFRLAFKDTFGIWFPCLKPRKIPEFFYSIAGGATVASNGPDYNASIRMAQQKRASIRHNGEASAIKHSASFHHLPSSQTQKQPYNSDHNSVAYSSSYKCNNTRDSSCSNNRNRLSVQNEAKVLSNSCGEMYSTINNGENTIIELNVDFANDSIQVSTNCEQKQQQISDSSTSSV